MMHIDRPTIAGPVAERAIRMHSFESLVGALGVTLTLISCDGSSMDSTTSTTSAGSTGQGGEHSTMCTESTCGTDAHCDAGACKCNDPLLDYCDGICANLIGDNANCGGCGNVCPSVDAKCTAGSCECLFGGTFCDGACVDIQKDEEHCGKCGATCDGTCEFGGCVSAFAASSETPRLVTGDGSNIVFSTFSNDLFAAPKAGGPNTTLSSGGFAIDAVTISGGVVYWATPNDIWSVPVGGGATKNVKHLDPTGFRVSRMLVEGTSLYFARGGLYSIPLAGGTVNQLQSSMTETAALVRRSGELWWIGPGPGADPYTAYHSAVPPWSPTSLPVVGNIGVSDGQYLFVTDGNSGCQISEGDDWVIAACPSSGDLFASFDGWVYWGKDGALFKASRLESVAQLTSYHKMNALYADSSGLYFSDESANAILRRALP